MSTGLEGFLQGWSAWVLPLAWQSLLLTLAALALDPAFHRRLWPQPLQALWILVLAKHWVSPGWHLSPALAAHLPEAAVAGGSSLQIRYAFERFKAVTSPPSSKEEREGTP